jgi:hypothetical protein
MRTRMSGRVAGESGRPLPLCRLWLVFRTRVGLFERGTFSLQRKKAAAGLQHSKSEDPGAGEDYIV